MTKIVFSNEATFHLSGHVAIVRMRWLKVLGTVSRPVAFVFYEKKMFGRCLFSRKHCEWYSVPRHVGRILYTC